jgi:hypothetical protein
LPGVAFPFVRRLLGLNTEDPELVDETFFHDGVEKKSAGVTGALNREMRKCFEDLQNFCDRRLIQINASVSQHSQATGFGFCYLKHSIR